VFDSIIDDIIFFKDKYSDRCDFLVTGDLNSRVGLLNDFVEDEYLFNLEFMPPDYAIDTNISRCSQDKVVNDNGKLLINFCKQTGLRIMNGRLGIDKLFGNFTCIKHNGSSVVDYVLCKKDLMQLFNRFYIDIPNILSDHCAVNFSLRSAVDNRCTSNDNNISQKSESEKIEFIYKWNPDLKTEFISKLNERDFQHKCQELTNELLIIDNNENINQNLSEFNIVFNNICQPLFRKNTEVNNKKNKNNNRWYDNECRQKNKHSIKH
jgi:hypothetical protein